jgi:hypothetical protein
MKEKGVKITTTGAIVLIIGIIIYYLLKALSVKHVIDIGNNVLDDINFYPMCAGLVMISLGMFIYSDSRYSEAVISKNENEIIKFFRMRYFLKGKTLFWGVQFLIWIINDYIFKFDDNHIIAYISILTEGILICIILFLLYRHKS